MVYFKCICDAFHSTEHLFYSGLRTDGLSYYRKQHRTSFPTPPARSFWRKRCFWGEAQHPFLKSSSLNGCLDQHLQVLIGPAGGLWSSHLFCFPLKFCFRWSQKSPCFLPELGPQPAFCGQNPAFPAHPCRKLQAPPGQSHSFSSRGQFIRPWFCFLSECCLCGPLQVNWGLAFPLSIQVRKVWDSQCTGDIDCGWLENWDRKREPTVFA